MSGNIFLIPLGYNFNTMAKKEEKQLLLRIKTSAYNKVKKRAKENERSINSQIVYEIDNKESTKKDQQHNYHSFKPSPKRELNTNN